MLTPAPFTSILIHVQLYADDVVLVLNAQFDQFTLRGKPNEIWRKTGFNHVQLTKVSLSTSAG